MDQSNYTLPPGHVLCLKVVSKDLQSLSSDAKGFQWPREGEVSAPDWSATPNCGGGLHGWLWGQGDFSAAGTIPPDAVWMVVEVEESACVEISRKVKFPRGRVVYAGDEVGAVWFVISRDPRPKTETASGDFSRAASSGDSSSAASSGNSSSAASSGDSSSAASSGNFSSAASSGNFSSAASSGDSSSAASSGNSSRAASSGDFSRAASSGDSSSAASSGNSSSAASSGDSSSAASSGNSSSAASSGDFSSAASSGDFSSAEQSGANGIAASIGSGGRVKAGPDGLLIACWWDGSRYRAATGCVGEDGIEADTWYVVKDGKLTKEA